jgi:hypothetical protein
MAFRSGSPNLGDASSRPRCARFAPVCAMGAYHLGGAALDLDAVEASELVIDRQFYCAPLVCSTCTVTQGDIFLKSIMIRSAIGRVAIRNSSTMHLSSLWPGQTPICRAAQYWN